MNDFDRKQIEILKPLLFYKDEQDILQKEPIALYYPFYANTFPLAYHYYLLLKENQIGEFEQHIKVHEWTSIFPSESNNLSYASALGDGKPWNCPARINVFYANEASTSTIVQIADGYYGEKISPVEYTNYIHRYIFLDYNIWGVNLYQHYNKEGYKENLRKLNGEKQGNEISAFVTINELAERLRNSNYKKLIVYTDIPIEAEILLKPIFQEFVELEILKQLKMNFIEINTSESLKIYFYGAPTTFYFLAKGSKYIPIEVESSTNNLSKGVACIHYNKDNHEKRIGKIKAALSAYHKNLFEKANSDDGPSNLNNIRIAYNKLAVLLGHPSYFKNPQFYSKCLAYHHKYTSEVGKPKPIEETINSNNESLEKCERKKIFHFGGGKLGLGLVLPLLKGNDQRRIEYSLIQKRRKATSQDSFDWSIYEKNEKIIIDCRNGCYPSKNKFELFVSTPTTSNEGDKIYFVNKYEEIFDLLLDADMISFSVSALEAQQEILDILKKNSKRFKKTILVLPFENKLAIAKGFTKNKIKYRILKADRICIDRLPEENTIKAINEEYYELVIFSETKTDTKFISNIFYSAVEPNVIICHDKYRYEFYEKRKKYLLNQLHFVLAIYGYHFLISNKISDWQNQYIPIIQSALMNDPLYKKPIETYIKAQIIRILIECKSSIYFSEIKFSNNDYEIVVNNLVEYANNVIYRFNKSEADPLHRIFAISTLFYENSLEVSLPNTEKIQEKFDDNYSDLKDFYASNVHNLASINFEDKPSTEEINSFLINYKSRIKEVFEGALTNANYLLETKENKIQKGIKYRRTKIDKYTAEVKKIVSEDA